MKRTGRQRPRTPGAVTWRSRAAGLGVLASMATRPVMLLVAVAVLALVIVLAAVIAGAAFAPDLLVEEVVAAVDAVAVDADAAMAARLSSRL